MKKLLKTAPAARILLVASVVLGFLGGILVILEATWIAKITDRAFLGGEGLHELLPALAVLLTWIVLRVLIHTVGEWTSTHMALKVKEDLRNRVVRKLIELGPQATKRERSGELLSTLYEGIEQLETFLARYIPQVALSTLIPVAVLCAVVRLDWTTTLILALTMPLLIFFMILVGMTTKSKTERQYKTLGVLSSHFHDVVRGLPTLRIFNRSKAQLEIIRQIGEEHRKATMATLRLAFLSAFVMELFATLCTAIVAVFLGLALIDGSIDFYSAYAALLLAPEYYGPMRALGTQFHTGANGRIAMERIMELLDQEAPGWTEREGARTLEEQGERAGGTSARPGYSIVLENVSFRYPEPLVKEELPEEGATDGLYVNGAADGLTEAETDREMEPAEASVAAASGFPVNRQAAALSSINLMIGAGQKVAVIGHTGSGKSTLLELLQGFLRPTEGHIRVNGVDMAELSIGWWRSKLAVVAQRAHLFQGTLLDNIRLGRPGATLAEVQAAARRAQADEFIGRLPQGYDTPVTEAVRLSGGQMQRLSIARALLKDAPVLLLDEPTAQLDLHNEALVQEAWRELFAGRTVVMAAHRLDTVRTADWLVVLQHGVIVEAGKPEELLRQGGIYAAMMKAAAGPDADQGLQEVKP